MGLSRVVSRTYPVKLEPQLFGCDLGLLHGIEVAVPVGLSLPVDTHVLLPLLDVKADVQQPQLAPRRDPLRVGWLDISPFSAVMGEEALLRLKRPGRSEERKLLAVSVEAIPHALPVAVGVVLVETRLLVSEVHLALLKAAESLDRIGTGLPQESEGKWFFEIRSTEETRPKLINSVSSVGLRHLNQRLPGER